MPRTLARVGACRTAEIAGLGGGGGMGYAGGVAMIHDELTIRSLYVRERAAELARLTGMTQDEVVEAALRAYAPPEPANLPSGLVRRGDVLVLAAEGRRTLTSEEAEKALEEIRNERC